MTTNPGQAEKVPGSGPALKVATVFGTRPEAIKMAPVIRRMRQFPERIEPVEIVTAQHRQMLDQVLELFSIVPRHDLDVMKPGQDLFDVTSRVLLGLKTVLQEERPDLMVVQGDTTTVFVAALAGFYLRIPVAHLEAGLRTGQRYSPFPEEINRTLASHLAVLHFAPTPKARENLLAEGVPAERIVITGNTVIDALLATVRQGYEFPGEVAECLQSGRRVLLVTAHRRESFGGPFEDLCRGLLAIADRFEDVQIVYPVHLNPNVQGPVRRLLGGHARISLIEPLSYEPFVQLMNRSTLVLTDSGGIQEEAPSLGKPVLVLRETTERPEAVDAGTVRLVGTDPERITAEASRLLTDPAAYAAMARAINPYGDGRASERVVDAILSFDFERERLPGPAQF
ncbi:MAG: UDP-N-acetylglucosamine 2-epimerase (non-hydrolyzing) [Candidatus Wallbacteria bacterium]|nr:UDP-N-acetylglucosamine 2-epimerase (non-hydrolyzing) [Candidatus Wallbacteria bacterium]